MYLFLALTHTHNHSHSHGSRGENIENKAMGQIAFRECRIGVPVSAVHIEDAAILCDWCGVAVCHILSCNGNAQFHLHQRIHVARKLQTKRLFFALDSLVVLVILFCVWLSPPAPVVQLRKKKRLHSRSICARSSHTNARCLCRFRTHSVR